MKFLEKDLEDIIFESDNSDLQDRGLDIFGTKKRQVRIGNYGVADLVTFQKPEYNTQTKLFMNPPIITIYELKKGTVDVESFFQLVRYATGIKLWVQRQHACFHDFNYEKGVYTGFDHGDLKFRYVLLGNRLTDYNGFKFLPEIFDIEFYLYNYKIDGIHFRHDNGWHLTQPGF